MEKVEEKQSELRETKDGFPETVINQWDRDITAWHAAQRVVHQNWDDLKGKGKQPKDLENPYQDADAGTSSTQVKQ